MQDVTFLLNNMIDLPKPSCCCSSCPSTASPTPLFIKVLEISSILEARHRIHSDDILHVIVVVKTSDIK
jgi:hypothetical protein